VDVPVTGLVATGAVGSLAVAANADIFVVGVQARCLVTPVLVWSVVDDSQVPNWSSISDSQSPAWAAVSDNQTPNWQNVGDSQSAGWTTVNDGNTVVWTRITT
jgi:hypothetical protein